MKALRILTGTFLVALFLYLAQWAVRDCASGLYTYDNCLWLWVREQSGLPPSKVLRSVALEIVGLVLVGALYLTIRYVFPRLKGINK